MIALAAIVLIASTVFLMAVPSAEAAEDEPSDMFADIRAETYLLAVGKTATYDIYAYGEKSTITFTAKLVDSNGYSVGRVSPSSGSLTDDTRALTVTAPESPGTYTLEVKFEFKGDVEGEITKKAPVRAVVPITLSAVLENKSGTLTDITVWFIVDGNVDERIGEQEITIGAKETKTVTHEWLGPLNGLSWGKHTVTLDAEIWLLSEDLINVESSVFYVGQNSYALSETLVVILFIILLIALIWVFRKPVKNLGKPKARR
ncbi:MAG: hypothetical protein FWD37_01870 [Methanomassiliicoccaceae archaeon]|nr:hypothetical protein [Methanomassiliicoccaceae archaeon]